MNKAIIAGRLTRDPEVSYKSDTQNCVAKFTLAADRGKKNGEDLGADFIKCVAFGKTAETIEKYVKKGDQIIVDGSIHTWEYTDENGEKKYTWNVAVRAFDFGKQTDHHAGGYSGGPSREEPPEDFEAVDEDVPF